MLHLKTNVSFDLTVTQFKKGIPFSLFSTLLFFWPGGWGGGEGKEGWVVLIRQKGLGNSYVKSSGSVKQNIKLSLQTVILCFEIHTHNIVPEIL